MGNRKAHFLTCLVFSVMLFDCSSGYMERIPEYEESSYDQQSEIYRLDSSRIAEEVLTSAINALTDSADVTGLAVSIFNGNHVVYKKAFGKANAQNGVDLKTNHVFYAASLSKAVFGYIAGELINEGTIDPDKPLQEYLDVPIPEMKTISPRRSYRDLKNDPRYKEITARMCLSHTSGLPNWRWIPRPDQPENDQKLRIYFDPGTKYSYSGEGMNLLQKVIRRITGKGLQELAEKRVFKPLGMRHTSYVWKDDFEMIYCHGHTADQEPVKKRKSSQSGAAGSMETTLDDYSKFVQHVMELASDSSEVTQTIFTPNIRIHSAAQFGPRAFKQTHENDDIKLSYGLGWGLLYTPYGYGAFKEGHDEGFQHYSIIFPQRGIGVVIMSNSDNAESIFKELLELTIADIYTPWKWENYIPY